jgi:hypothetical protein
MTKILLLITSLALLATATRAEVPPSAREGIEWCDIWISNANKTNLPRVLLLGDSIARGYYPAVEKRLAGKAFVTRLTTSAFVSDPMFHQQIALVLDHTRFDVIHFNNGLHGWQLSEADYRKAFPDFLATLQKHAPNAKLIWATTTPHKPTTNAPPANSSNEATKRVAARNTIALEFVAAKKIPVNDLFTPLLGRAELYSDGVHFNREGIALQANQVAAEIEKLLPR